MSFQLISQPSDRFVRLQPSRLQWSLLPRFSTLPVAALIPFSEMSLNSSFSLQYVSWGVRRKLSVGGINHRQTFCTPSSLWFWWNRQSIWKNSSNVLCWWIYTYFLSTDLSQLSCYWPAGLFVWVTLPPNSHKVFFLPRGKVAANQRSLYFQHCSNLRETHRI